jgi:hypothetical protein
MTEFQQEFRHYCRNPRCRSKLPAPVSNPREAFCARGCHSSFYRKRCLVCEAKMERKTEHQLVCGKRKCRNALQAGQSLGRYHAARTVVSTPKNAANTGIKSPVADGRGWRIVAGPPLTPSQLHCATVPDGPDLGLDGLPTWEGGSFQRIEARNKAMLRAHFREKAAECLIQPHHPPVNVLGGYKFPDAPAVDLTPIEQETPIPTTNPLYPEPGVDPLEIPRFLRRPLPRSERDYRLAA